MYFFYIESVYVPDAFKSKYIQPYRQLDNVIHGYFVYILKLGQLATK